MLGNDQGMLIVARMLAAFVPHYLGFMLPLALYWGSITVVRQFTVSSEASVLQATGSSIARCFAALLVLGVVFACVNLVVVGWLQPRRPTTISASVTAPSPMSGRGPSSSRRSIPTVAASRRS